MIRKRPFWNPSPAPQLQKQRPLRLQPPQVLQAPDRLHPPAAAHSQYTCRICRSPREIRRIALFLYLAGALLLLLLLAGGVWAVFFRDTGNAEVSGGEPEVPAVVVEPTATPDAAATQEAIDAGVAAAVETRVADAATQTAEAAIPLPTATLEPTAEPTPEPQETGEAGAPTAIPGPR